MTLPVSVKSSEQKPWYNLRFKILTPSKRRGLEHSSSFLVSPKSTATEDKVGSMYQFCWFQTTVICSDKKV